MVAVKRLQCLKSGQHIPRMKQASKPEKGGGIEAPRATSIEGLSVGVDDALQYGNTRD